MFLEETHQQKKHRRDFGLEVGEWLLSRFRTTKTCPMGDFSKAGEANFHECRSLLDDAEQDEEKPPGYRSTETSPSPSMRRPLPLHKHDQGGAVISKAGSQPSKSMEKAFTKQVILNIIGYGILA